MVLATATAITSAEILAGGAILAAAVPALIGLLLALRHGQRQIRIEQGEIHLLANSQLSRALDKIEGLEERLGTALEQINCLGGMLEEARTERNGRRASGP